MPKNRTESALIKNLINNQIATEIHAKKDIVLRSIFLRRIEMPNAANMKTRGRVRSKMKEVSGTFLVGRSEKGVKIEDVTRSTLLLRVGSAFFDCSRVELKGFSIDFQLSIPNQMAPAMNMIPKIVRMFLVKKDSIFFCCSLFGRSSSLGRLEYL
jgi:hypothetical protein